MFSITRRSFLRRVSQVMEKSWRGFGTIFVENNVSRRKESERAYKPDSVFAAKSRDNSKAVTPNSDAEAIIPLGRRSLDGSMRPTRGFRENAAKRSHI
jgi:hypothetical protein